MISGSNANNLIYNGAGTSALAGREHIQWHRLRHRGRRLLVSSDANLGNSANPININNDSSLGATASFSSNRAISFNVLNTSDQIVPDIGTLDVLGSSTVWTANGQISGGTLTVNNPVPGATTPLPGMLVLTNRANNHAETVLSDGTLSINSPGCIGSGPLQFLGLEDGSTMVFANSMTLSNELDFPVTGKKAIWFDTQANNVTLTGQLVPATTKYYSVDMYKVGSGLLNLAAGDTTNMAATKGNWHVNQGTLELSGVTSYYTRWAKATSRSAPVRPCNSPMCSWATQTTRPAPLTRSGMSNSIPGRPRSRLARR